MKDCPKRDAERRLIVMERGLLACYELAEQGRKKVKAQRKKVKELRDV